MLPRPHTNQQRYELIDKPRNVLGKAQNVAREREWGLNELFLKQRRAQWKLSGRDVASYPGSRWAGKERAWYPLFAHALNFPEILGNRKLSCYIRTTVTT